MLNSYLPLISLWEEYIDATGNVDVELFALWVLEKKKDRREISKEDTSLQTYYDNQTASFNFPKRSSEAAVTLWRLSKFVRFYTRPVLLANGLSSQDDFAILAHADYSNNCTKKEAIEANIIDQTTGIEIIRRLVKQGLLNEIPNDADRRERLISLTNIGREKLYAIYEGFASIQDVMANLNANEREILFVMLKNLDDFHTKNHTKLLEKNKS